MCFGLAQKGSGGLLCKKMRMCANLLPFCTTDAGQRYALGNQDRTDVDAQEDDPDSVKQPDGEYGVDIHPGVVQRACKQNVETHSTDMLWQRIIFATEKI